MSEKEVLEGKIKDQGDKVVTSSSFSMKQCFGSF